MSELSPPPDPGSGNLHPALHARARTGPPPFPRHPTPDFFPTTASNDGRLAWAFGLLSLLAVPLLSLLVPSILMLVVGLAQLGRNAVARRSGLRAALLGGANLLIVVLYLVMLGTLTRVLGGIDAQEQPGVFYGLALPGLVYICVLAPLVNIVLGIVALARPVSRQRAARILAQG
ncbi:hypothetical protein BF93_14860 [Brachybacterium phenoliresistens]|uniref:Uncharacterized protein n=1 Tax=Brachybacterium phenoliresistens TaxID=396014 RepID=Z9JVL9_9MICO|nr:hypothetical protein [Brachybacterium phenoliresistens]EWS81832.1 hypothetical protein BF93_14860 [Brachybacterium phenoliresistens]